MSALAGTVQTVTPGAVGTLLFIVPGYKSTKSRKKRHISVIYENYNNFTNVSVLFSQRNV